MLERKDQRVRITKLLIRKAFLKLLNAKPIQNISVRELCEEAGINRGTFYTHYEDIYDLLNQIEQEMLMEFKENLNKRLEHSKEGVLSPFLFQNIFQFLADNSDICTIMLGENSDKKFMTKMLELGKEECVSSYSLYFKSASSTQIEDFYTFVSNGCIGLLTKWVKEDMKESPEELAQTAEKIMNHAIGFLED